MFIKLELIKELYCSVVTTLVYNDTKHSVLFMTLLHIVQLYLENVELIGVLAFSCQKLMLIYLYSVYFVHYDEVKNLRNVKECTVL